jgi:ADP-ribose pyrophosphatase YjhB (NUDIX family)
MQKDQWLQWAVELQSIAQSALYYCKDAYDIERFNRIRAISAEMIHYQSDIPMEKVMDVFCCETGYQTPKLDVRAAVFEGDKILLVQENDGLWALPGGWVDVNLSVMETVIKEAKEEAGLDVTADRIIAVQDRDKHNAPIYAYKICKIFVYCTATGGSFTENIETMASRYFPMEDLPPLATSKTNAEQIKMCFDAHRSANWQTLFD